MGHFPDLGALVGVEGGVSGVFGELCTDAPLEHFLIALLEPGGHVLQSFLLGSESEQGLRYAFFQWNRMDFLFELSEQPSNPPKSPSREVLEQGLLGVRLSLWSVEELGVLVGAVVQRVVLGSRRASADNCRCSRRPSSRPSRGRGRYRWRRSLLCSSCRRTRRTHAASCCRLGGSVIVGVGC